MRAHLFRPLQDAAGNLQRGATVRVFEAGTETLLAEPLYVSDDEENFDTYSQPVACPNGYVTIFFGRPRRVRLGVTPFGGGTEVFFDNIDAFVPQVRASDVTISLSEINATDVRSAIYEIVTTKYGPGNPPPSGSGSTAEGTFFAPYGSATESNVQRAIQNLVNYKYGPDVPEAFRLHGVAEDLTLEPYDKVVFVTTAPVTVTLPPLGDDAPPPPPPPADSDGDGIPDFEDPDYVPPPPPGSADPLADDDGDGVVNFEDPDWVPPEEEEPEGPSQATFVRRDLGRTYVIKNLNTEVLTVAAGLSAAGVATAIDGDPTRTLAQYDVLTVVWDGTNWGVI